MYRKVDKGSYIVMQCISNGDIYVTVEDKLIGKELHKHPSRSIFHTLLEPVAGMNLENSNF